ncbi:hypothetical protein [Kocuria sabuli]|uniref:hypothetical protein n=1 Tax=Kocuria sabuli TaxID=3071448 RepID=UPI0034D69D9A
MDELGGGVGQQVPLEPGQVQAVVQTGLDLDLPGVTAEDEVVDPQLPHLDTGTADDLEQQVGLFGPDLVGIHRANSGARVRVSLKDLAGDLDHGPALGE